MWTLIIIIVVVVVVDDDTYYWVYLSSDHLFQVYYKVRQVLLQSATAFFITKYDGLLLQSATAFLLQSATIVITKCDRYYKVRQFYYKVRQYRPYYYDAFSEFRKEAFVFAFLYFYKSFVYGRVWMSSWRVVPRH